MSIRLVVTASHGALTREDHRELDLIVRHGQFGDGEMLDLTLAPHQEKRSLDTNAYIHAEPIPKFAEAFGYTPAEAKLWLLGQFFGWKELHAVGGSPVLNYVPNEPSSADLTKEQMSKWIEWLIQFGAEQGLNILPPEKDPAKRDPRVRVA